MTNRQFRILIDGECPVCRREGEFLRWLDGGRGRLVIEDITAEGFDPARYGTTMDALMGQIHGVTPAGTVLTGMAVFRYAYDALGLGWILAPTAWPIIKPIADAGYRWFARNRWRLTGRRDRCPGDRCAAE